MLDDVKIFCNHIFVVKMSRYCHLLGKGINGRHYLICKPLVVYRFYCMVLYHSQTRRHMIQFFRTFTVLFYMGLSQ